MVIVLRSDIVRVLGIVFVLVVDLFFLPAWCAVLHVAAGTVVLFYERMPLLMRMSCFLFTGVLIGAAVMGDGELQQRLVTALVPLLLGLLGVVVAQLRSRQRKADAAC